VNVKLAYVGGPTALIDVAGLRFLTDPTFDPAPGNYKSTATTLHKLRGPVRSAESLGHVDAVLLSHDHHFDNLDHSGRKFLSRAAQVITTPEGAERLRGNALGLAPWQSFDLRALNDVTVRVTATPARHGPAHMNRGAVAGFVLTVLDEPEHAIYFSGDTVWYEGVEEVGERFQIRTALLNLGAARVPEVGPWHLTMTANEAVIFAKMFPEATVVPLHYEGWAHFSESREDIKRAFEEAGLVKRLQWIDR